MQAQATITQEFGSRASKLVGDTAQAKLEEAQLKRLQADAAQAAGDTERANQLNAQADQLQSDWGDNGTKRLAAHTAIGALTGGTQGATGAAVGTLSAPAIASALKNAGLDDTLTDGLTALASTAAGAATGGTQGGAAAFNEVVNNYLSHQESQRLQEIDQLLEDDEQALSETQRQALEEERLAIRQLDRSRDDALETACGQGGSAAACSYERSLLEAAFSSWQPGDVDRETYSDYQHTATLWGEHQQQRMEHIGAEALTDMVVDSATAPLILGQLAGQAALGDEESRAILREMGNEIKAFAANPAEHISENNREQLAHADALEQAGQRDEADRLRMRVALENQTMIMGAGGLAASLPKVASSIASRPGRVGLDGSGVTQDVPNHGVRPGATDAEASGASYYDQYRKADGSGWDWPENMGFSEKPTESTLPVGTRIDRYGSPNGAFMSPEGTPIDHRAMAPGSLAEPHHIYEVQKPLPVIQGEIAPAFGQPGGGTQMLPNLPDRVNVQWLINEGYLRKGN